MPKENRWLIRNKKIRAENDFNRVMREFVTYKYGPVATECTAFYDMLRTKYPDNGTYLGAKKFRKWVTSEIKNHINNEQADDRIQDNNQANNGEVYGEIQDNNQANSGEVNDEIQDNNQANSGEVNDEIQDNNQANSGEVNDEIQDNNQANNEGIHNQANNEIGDEIENILREIENGNILLDTSNDDEGIHLDCYEEFVGDIEDLDIDVDNIFW